MKYYLIKPPVISKSLTIIHNREIEVLECEAVEYNNLVRCRTVAIHSYKKGMWHVENSSDDDMMFGTGLHNPIHTSVVRENNYDNFSLQYVIFTNLEDAKVSKFLLHKDLDKYYKNKIEKITKLREKQQKFCDDNIPHGVI